MTASARTWYAALGMLASCLGAGRDAAADPRNLSLADALRTAIASDADLYIAREDARVAESGIALTRATFEPHLFGLLYASRDDQPPSATTFGAVDKIGAATVGVTGGLQRTGLTYTVTSSLLRRVRDDRFLTVYRPGVTTTVRAEVVQPLRRGAFSAARRPTVVASLRQALGEQLLRARIEHTLGTVQVAYWNLVRALSERAARTLALQLAVEQVDESKRLAKIGNGSDLDVTDAQAGASRRRQELLRTEQEVAETEGKLYEALGVRPTDDGWAATSTIVPTDDAGIDPTPIDVEAQLALARSHRSDVLAARARTAAESAELEHAADQRRASVDLVVAAGTTGFAGSLADTQATVGLDDPTSMYRADPDYSGGLGTALVNTLGRDPNVYVGLRFELPLGTTAADIQYAIQARTVTRAELAERVTLAKIESEVRTTVARLAIDVRLITAADEAVALSGQLLEGTRKRFRAGGSTSFDVLRVSEQQTQAQIDAGRARADYRISLTRLGAATGTLMERADVKLGTAPR